MLDAGERARHDRLLFERNRIEFLATRFLARTVLSLYAPVEPGAWSFRAGPHGKPEIAAHQDLLWLRFNLSNTSGLVALAVARDLEIGLDVEDTTRDVEILDLADRFFAPDEAAALRALPPDAQRGRFFRLWTLKESYLKARGAGLSLPLGLFSFAFDAAGGVTLAFRPGLDDRAERWRFFESRPTPTHALAFAAPCGGRDLAVRFHSAGI